ncbi:MAG: phosphonoacetaldehyde dehydrogenase [Deltaproteobacteria bacterium]|nr:phosphonoacetaldehyde dehydrogenase [Deltaproteobacteria bacterium]
MKTEAMRILGEKVSRERTYEVKNPYSGAVVAKVAMASVADIDHAIEGAARAKLTLTRFERAKILERTAQILEDRKQTVADVITSESGLCKKDTLYEVGRAQDVLNLAARLLNQDDGEAFACDLTPHGKKRRIFTLREPLAGVITAITPFNHPLNQVAHKVAPSIATNNRMILKPSEKTPLSAFLLADALYEAGLPPEMLSIVSGDPKEIGERLITHPKVDLVTFTGGVAIGKWIAERAGYKRLVLELGGNDPLIVMDDADLDEAVALAVNGSYKNSGQRCTAVKRMLVHEKIADAFVAGLVEKTKALKYGDPSDPATDMGTVIDEAAAKICEERVNDAIARGGKLLYGNVRKGALYSPTVVDHVKADWTLVKEETFGPVSPIIRFKNIDEAIALSNSTAYGLSSGVCTNRLDDVMRFVRELQVGTVNVREVPGYRTEMSPFGGIKDSGLGYKEGVKEAMKSFTNLKTFSLPWM